MKHRVQTEKTRAQNYRDTIKEMAERMDKVSQKNSSLWQKAKQMKKVEGPRPASRGYDYMKKEEPIRDIKLKRE